MSGTVKRVRDRKERSTIIMSERKLNKQQPNEKHLEFIEATISRMSDKSLQVRNWCVTIVTALFAFVFTQNQTKEIIFATGVIATALILLFWLQDARYQYFESGFRWLYKMVAGIETKQPPDFVQDFSMHIPRSQRGFKKYMLSVRKTGLFYFCLLAIFVGISFYLYTR